jgi:hypothetical protein
MAKFNGKHQYSGIEATNIGLGQNGFIFTSTAAKTYKVVDLSARYDIQSAATGTAGDNSDTQLNILNHPFINGDIIGVSGTTNHNDADWTIDEVHELLSVDIPDAFVTAAETGTAYYKQTRDSSDGIYYYDEKEFPYFCGVKVYSTVTSNSGLDIATLDLTLADGCNSELGPGESSLTVKMRGGDVLFGQFSAVKTTTLTSCNVILLKG